MADPKRQEKKSFSPDWLVRGVLTRLGDTFDKITGRGWKPSSSLATSELIERLKKLMDAEVRDEEGNGKFVPHKIQLKMQWDKFSTDSEQSITKLENELLTAAIDHINDNRYHTYAPIDLKIKPDYFTEGVRLLASFDEFADEPHEAELNVTLPNLNAVGLVPDETDSGISTAPAAPVEQKYEAVFTASGGPKRTELVFAGNRRLSVGRTGTNDLVINDQSISKIHASLSFDPENGLMVADTGSTNGTFINGERISYGKAYAVEDGAITRFGTVDVVFDRIEKLPEPEAETIEEEDPEDTIAIGEFEFKTRKNVEGVPETLASDGPETGAGTEETGESAQAAPAPPDTPGSGDPVKTIEG